MTADGTPPDDVLTDARTPSVRRRIRHPWSSSDWVRRHPRLATRTATVLVVGAGLTAAAFALRSPAGTPVPEPRVTGISLDVPSPDAAGVLRRPIVATYRAATRAGDRLQVRGVSGPFVRASTGQAAGPGTSLFTVTVTPDCRQAASLAAARRAYRLVVSRTGADGRTTRSRVPLAGTTDWGAAIREVCWRRLVQHGIRVDDVRAVADPAPRRVLLQVALRSRLARDVRVQAIDVADVSTLEDSDSGDLPGGGRRVLRVRLPVGDCTSPAAPALAWSVGPPGGDPAAVLVTGLSPAQQGTVQAAVRRLCAPPRTAVRVLSARTVAGNPVVDDRTGVAISLRLSVVTDARSMVVGQSTARLTSDARVSFSEARVALPAARATATVVWQASCSPPGAAPPVLPLHLGVPRHVAGYAVTLDGAALASTYGAACRLDAGRLHSLGWRTARSR